MAEAWGWTTYFTEIAAFIESSNRRFGRYVNRQFVEHVVDRLTGYSHHITDLRQHIADARQTAGIDGRALQSLMLSMDQLLHLLHQLIQQWQQHLEHLAFKGHHLGTLHQDSNPQALGVPLSLLHKNSLCIYGHCSFPGQTSAEC